MIVEFVLEEGMPRGVGILSVNVPEKVTLTANK